MRLPFLQKHNSPATYQILHSRSGIAPCDYTPCGLACFAAHSAWHLRSRLWLQKKPLRQPEPCPSQLHPRSRRPGGGASRLIVVAQPVRLRLAVDVGRWTMVAGRPAVGAACSSLFRCFVQRESQQGRRLRPGRLAFLASNGAETKGSGEPRTNRHPHMFPGGFVSAIRTIDLGGR